MTGIELLRKYAETRQAAATCRQLPDALGKECDDFGSCSDCHRFVCKAIADQIEREAERTVPAVQRGDSQIGFAVLSEMWGEGGGRMTGIEMLREWANKLREAACAYRDGEIDYVPIDMEARQRKNAARLDAIADQIEREIEEAVADEVADTLSAYEMNTNARWYSAVEDGAESDCKAEYEMISRYWLPRPRFDDGEPVQFGDEFYCGNSQTTVGDTWNVKRMTFYSNGNTIVADNRFSSTMLAPCERLRRPEPPDTWERLTVDIEDCDGSACRYFGMNEEEGRAPCSGCKAYNDETDCTVQVMLDLVRRAKKLAGVEE